MTDDKKRIAKVMEQIAQMNSCDRKKFLELIKKDLGEDISKRTEALLRHYDGT